MSDLVYIKGELPMLPYGREFQSLTIQRKWRESEYMERRLPRLYSNPVFIQILNQPRFKFVRLFYDKDGLPVDEEGYPRPFTPQEILKLQMDAQKPASCYPKNVKSKRKIKRRKNPPPRKVDIDTLFREEEERTEKMEKFK